MGSLRRRGRIWWIRYYRDGRRYEESAGTTHKTAAAQLLRLREGAIAQGLPITPALGRYAFDAAAADLLADYRIHGRRSIADVQRRLTKHLRPAFGGRRLAAITTADIRAYIDQRQRDGASPASVNRELAALRRLYTLALQAGHVLHRPHIPHLREPAPRTGFFEPAEFEAVRAALPCALRPVAHFAYLTGWRVPSEVLPLQWRQVDWAAGLVRLDPGTTKTGEGRVFPFDVLPELRALLADRRADTDAVQRETGAVIPHVFHRHGAPIKSWYAAWRSACARAGVPGRIPHDFRRTAVRNLVRAGVPERVAMRLTGHKTRAVFDRYHIIVEADLRDAVARLADARPAARDDAGRRATVHTLGR